MKYFKLLGITIYFDKMKDIFQEKSILIGVIARVIYAL